MSCRRRWWLCAAVSVYCVLVLALLESGAASACAQANQWTWMSGSNLEPTLGGGYYGIYGDMRVTAPDNHPGSRRDSSSWTDQRGRLWLFGGNGFDANGMFGLLSDMWMYDPAAGVWTWMGGGSIIPSNLWAEPGAYGSAGIADPGTHPGGRSNATSWTDSQGHFWLLGGFGADGQGNLCLLNDLWEFDPVANQWSWISGNQVTGPNGGRAGIYGTLGAAGPESVPGARINAASWTDRQGHLWLFGGIGFDADGQNGWLNDFWQFDPSTGQWTWLAGSSTISVSGSGLPGQPGAYGSLERPSSENLPGSRYRSTQWIDTDGHLWLFGGFGADASFAFGFLNDLWEFDPSMKQWAWMGGSNSTTQGDSGVYGTLGTGASSNFPGSREGPVSWTDSRGRLWLFGGYGTDSSGTSGWLNDLWEFDPANHTWTWMDGNPSVGSNGGQPPVYGGLGVGGVGANPGARSPAATWTDSCGNFWLFAGADPNEYANPGELNDLWTYQPYARETTAAPTFNLAPGTYGTSQTVTIADPTPGAIIYYTTDGSTPNTGSARYTGPVTLRATTTLRSIAVVACSSTSSITTAAYTITAPAAPAFTLTASPASLAMKSGEVGTVTLGLAPLNGFASPVHFTCSGLSPGLSCTFSPASVTPAQPTHVVLTIAAATKSAGLAKPGSSRWPVAALAMGGILILFRRRRLYSAVLLALISAATGMLSGCGYTLTPPAPTSPVVSTVTVTAVSGTITQAVKLSITVN